MSGPKTHSWITDLNVYPAGKSRAVGVAEIHKLSANESALGPSPLAVEAYTEAALSLHRYPDPIYFDLRSALAEKYDIEANQIMCGAGSDDLLKQVCRAYLSPGDEAIFVAHSFLIYPIAIKSVGAVGVEVKDTDYTTNIDNIIAAINDKTRLIFIANPNNPTGTVIMKDEIERLWKNIPEHVLLVLDSAYAEFVEDENYDAGIDLVRRSKNVLMTRTFSKLYGLAALRLGWGYACPDIAQTLDKVRDPFNIPSSAQAAGIAALKDKNFEDNVIRFTNEWRRWLANELTALGLKVIPSVTNFIMFKFENKNKTAVNANNFLVQNGYILRYYSGQGLGNFLRLTVGTADENKTVIKLIKQFLED